MSKKDGEKPEEEIKKVENPKEKPEGEKPEEKEQIVTIESLQVELDTANRSLVNKTEEAKRVHGKLEEYEKADEQKKLDEMTEMEKLQVQLSEKDTALSEKSKEIETFKLNEQKRKIAKEIGLPDAFALKINGATPEEMEIDAKAMLGAMPKGAKVPFITNPPSGSETNETDVEKKKRLGMIRSH